MERQRTPRDTGVAHLSLEHAPSHTHTFKHTHTCTHIHINTFIHRHICLQLHNVCKLISLSLSHTRTLTLAGDFLSDFLPLLSSFSASSSPLLLFLEEIIVCLSQCEVDSLSHIVLTHTHTHTYIPSVSLSLSHTHTHTLTSPRIHTLTHTNTHTYTHTFPKGR